MIQVKQNFPSLVKYMGSKTELINFIEHGINIIHRENQDICDLFAGSATLSGALRGQCNIISNDIQSYSSIFSKAYLINYNIDEYPSIDQIISQICNRVNEFNMVFSYFSNNFKYDKDFSLDEFDQLEKSQQDLINFDEFKKFDNYYLFTKYYSGTYWSYEQCVWIDSIKCIADRYRDKESLYILMLSSLMYAMAYNSQSTGHYAQYRDAKNLKSMNDILIYRRKSIIGLFEKKMNELILWCKNSNEYSFTTTTLDYEICLNKLQEGTLVYADPPYCFVHYSRFYHAIETLIKYDYPKVAYKGRYREDRHQSPFCIKTQVSKAFRSMFKIIRDRNLELVLSYSNSETNTIDLLDLLTICFMTINRIEDQDIYDIIRNQIHACIDINNEYTSTMYEELSITNENLRQYEELSMYDIKLVFADHNHSTMGRTEDRTRQVKEVLVILKRRG